MVAKVCGRPLKSKAFKGAAPGRWLQNLNLPEAAMDKSGFRTIPHALSECITFLVRALPVRSVPTFLELLVGAMLTQAGFVSQAWLAVDMRRHWSSYYKWLQEGKWSWTALGLQTARLLISLFPGSRWLWVIDDTLLLRASKKAPGSGIHHDHAHKANRPQFVRGQCWVSLAAVVENGLAAAAIPLLSRLIRVEGNQGKLTAAMALVRAIAPVFLGEAVCLLLDSWYMRHSLITFARGKGVHVIGQVRKDTALYDIPSATGKRGRPRVYGDQYTTERVAALPSTRVRLHLYGKEQWIHYKSVTAKARFLGGQIVRAVWTTFEYEDGALSKPRLLLATNCSLTPLEVITTYARRWTIETMFAQVKNNWGWKDAWQQSRQVLHRWIHILGLGYALPQLLTVIGGEQAKALAVVAPWRKDRPITAAMVRLGLQRIFAHVSVRDCWNPKSRKFEQPKKAVSPPSPEEIPKAA